MLCFSHSSSSFCTVRTSLNKCSSFMQMPYYSAVSLSRRIDHHHHHHSLFYYAAPCGLLRAFLRTFMVVSVVVGVPPFSSRLSPPRYAPMPLYVFFLSSRRPFLLFSSLCSLEHFSEFSDSQIGLTEGLVLLTKRKSLIY